MLFEFRAHSLPFRRQLILLFDISECNGLPDLDVLIAASHGRTERDESVTLT